MVINNAKGLRRTTVMQNTGLRLSRDELETTQTKYIELYDFAPVGFITLDSKRVISTVNLAGAGLVGGVRSRLIGRRFVLFVAIADRHFLNDFLDKVLTCRVKESCEVALLNQGNQPVIVQIEAMATASGQEFRLALIDITKRRCTEEALKEKQQELIKLNDSLEVRIADGLNALRLKDQMLILQDPRAVMGEGDQQYRTPMVSTAEHKGIQRIYL